MVDARFPYPPHGVGFKRAGGPSEQAARALAKGAAKAKREIVFDRLQIAGDLGMTPDELAADLNISILTVRPRCTELMHLGRIEETGQRRKSAGARIATTVFRVSRLAPHEQSGGPNG